MCHKQKLVQISDGSWHPVEHTNICSFCKCRKKIDDVKQRGTEDAVCLECAIKYDINYCRVCGKKIPLYGGYKERTRCKDCASKKCAYQKIRRRELTTYRKLLEEIEPEHRDIALKLIMIGDAQKAGIIKKKILKD